MSYRDRRSGVRLRPTPTEWVILSLMLLAVLVLAAGRFFAVLPEESSAVRYTPGTGSSQAASQAGSQAVSQAASQADARIHLNTADKAALMTLPHIGESRAEAILAYRAENGPFTSVEELLEIRGIGESVLAAIRDFIAV